MATTKAKSRITIIIRERLDIRSTFDTYWRAIVETRTHAYYCDFTGDRPREDHVREAWKEDRRAFAPGYGS